MCVEDGDDGSSYRGDVAVTETGEVCEKWDTKYTGLEYDPWPDN